MTKRVLAMILILLLLSGCARGAEAQSAPETDSGAAQAPESVPLTEVKLGYDPQDSFNPYTCATQINSYLAGLLYEPLAALDVSYNAQPRLALDIVLGGSVCVVTLREGLRFWDGSALTAEDVVYSLNTAKANLRYSAQLAGVVSAAATAENVVTITLSAPDVFFDRSLTFPVVKTGTAAEEQPVGAGRFVYNAAQDGFSRNSHYYGGTEGGIQTVRLVPLGSDEEQTFLVMSGGVDMIYSDLRRSVDLGYGGGHSMVSLNDLVFMGVNRAGFGFGEDFMELLGWLMPRSNIAAKAYSGYATATGDIINPAMEASTAGSTATATAQQITQRLRELGFGEPGEEGLRRRYGKDFALTLIVGERAQRRSAAAQIAQEFGRYGLSLRVEELTDAEFSARLAAGNYELYLGEVRLADNMDVSALLTPGEGAYSGIVWDEALLAAYSGLKDGSLAVEDFGKLFVQRPTVIPLVFRRGIVWRSKSFSADIVATQQDIFYNILDW